MSLAPTPYRLRVRSWSEGEPDAFGNSTASWSERDWLVAAIAPGGIDDLMEPNRDLTLVVWTVYGPKEGAPTSSRDEVRLPGDSHWYPLHEHPRDWTKGPWGKHPTAGVVAELRRADG